jgi:hypothetical protein
MSSRSQKFEAFQKSILEQLIATNERLDKVIALMISDQLLQECITPEGQPRSAEECAGIVQESFCAGMCLAPELSNKSKEFAYQMSEFFIEENENEDEVEEDEDDDDEDDDFPENHPALTF